MTPDDPAGPADETPSPQPPGQRGRRREGGSVALGIVAGIVGLFGLYFVLAMAAGPGWIAALLPIVVYVFGSVLLAVRPRTARFGAGLLIGLGVWLLVGGGLCIAILVPTGGFA
jgi:hypothetical protein